MDPGGKSRLAEPPFGAAVTAAMIVGSWMQNERFCVAGSADEANMVARVGSAQYCTCQPEPSRRCRLFDADEPDP